MKKLCLLLIIVLLAGCTAQATTQPETKPYVPPGMIIEGPDQFKKDIQSGMDLLKEKAPEYYKLVNENIIKVYLNDKDENCIYFGKFYGMSKEAYANYTNNPKNIPYTMALALVHEGRHAERIKQGYFTRTSEKEERIAVEAEKNAAKLMGAPPEIMEFLDIAIETRWWEKQGK